MRSLEIRVEPRDPRVEHRGRSERRSSRTRHVRLFHEESPFVLDRASRSLRSTSLTRPTASSTPTLERDRLLPRADRRRPRRRAPRAAEDKGPVGLDDRPRQTGRHDRSSSSAPTCSVAVRARPGLPRSTRKRESDGLASPTSRCATWSRCSGPTAEARDREAVRRRRRLARRDADPAVGARSPRGDGKRAAHLRLVAPDTREHRLLLGRP